MDGGWVHDGYPRVPRDPVEVAEVAFRVLVVFSLLDLKQSLAFELSDASFDGAFAELGFAPDRAYRWPGSALLLVVEVSDLDQYEELRRTGRALGGRGRTAESECELDRVEAHWGLRRA